MKRDRTVGIPGEPGHSAFPGKYRTSSGPLKYSKLAVSAYIKSFKKLRKVVFLQHQRNRDIRCTGLWRGEGGGGVGLWISLVPYSVKVLNPTPHPYLLPCYFLRSLYCYRFPKPGLTLSFSWLIMKRSKFQLTHLRQTFALHPLGLRQFLFFHGYKHETWFAESDVTHLNDKCVVVSLIPVFLADISWLFGKVGCQ